MTDRMTEARKAEMLAGVPAKRYGTVEESGGALAIFLASEPAGYVSGVVLPVDGGVGMGI